MFECKWPTITQFKSIFRSDSVATPAGCFPCICECQFYCWPQTYNNRNYNSCGNLVCSLLFFTLAAVVVVVVVHAPAVRGLPTGIYIKLLLYPMYTYKLHVFLFAGVLMERGEEKKKKTAWSGEKSRLASLPSCKRRRLSIWGADRTLHIIIRIYIYEFLYGMLFRHPPTNKYPDMDRNHLRLAKNK